MSLLPAYRLKLYRNFKAIESADYQGIVRYYERFEDDIQGLDFEEYFDCTVAYAGALFETGAYGKHLVMADHLLETVIMQNVETWGGEDIYAKLLFKKAAALFHLEAYPQAEHILRELIKIHPWDKVTARFLRSVLCRQKPAWLPRTRAAALGFILFSAVVIGLEFCVLKPFFPAFLGLAKDFHIGLFATGLLVLAAGEIRHVWNCFQKTETFAARHRRKKSFEF